MNKAIVTTTINKPTDAIHKFIKIAQRDNWHIFVVGDKKTPGAAHAVLEQEHHFYHYITPEQQEFMSKELSDLIGWNCIQRRNFGFIAAMKNGADIIATIDDDNIPYDNWGKDLLVGTAANLDIYDGSGAVYNPLERHDFGYRAINICKDPLAGYEMELPLWHRGVPEQQVDWASVPAITMSIGKEKRPVLVQADLWDGDPDISAVARMVLHPEVKFTHKNAYAGVRIGPFNSQNTFLDKSVMRDYFMFPHIGRMDDIWASYYLQAKHGLCVAYGRATVYQERNPHDLSKDLAAEQIGYMHSQSFYDQVTAADDDNGRDAALNKYVGDLSYRAFRVYQDLIDGSQA